jgi:hypothetical protein
VPIKDPHAVRPIVVYVVSEGDFKGAEPNAYMLVDKNEEEQVYAKVIITGAADLSSIQTAIGLAKKKLMEHTEADSLVLPADVLLNGDKSALVFNASGTTYS